jgi:hypothetical protein
MPHNARVEATTSMGAALCRQRAENGRPVDHKEGRAVRKALDHRTLTDRHPE